MLGYFCSEECTSELRNKLFHHQYPEFSPSNKDCVGRRIGAGDPHDQAEIGNQTIVGSLYGCPKGITAYGAMTSLKPNEYAAFPTPVQEFL